MTGLTEQLPISYNTNQKSLAWSYQDLTKHCERLVQEQDPHAFATLSVEEDLTLSIFHDHHAPSFPVLHGYNPHQRETTEIR